MSKRVAIVMGSDSDWPTVQETGKALDELQIPWEAHVMSAHRTPELVQEFASGASDNGIGVIIAAAGGAAHLAGVIAAHTVLPVIGIPIQTASLGGLDSLLSTVQMPGGIPVATMAIGNAGARNAGLYAGHILGVADNSLTERLVTFRSDMQTKVSAKNDALLNKLNE